MAKLEQSRWASVSGAAVAPVRPRQPTGGPAPAAEEIGVVPTPVAPMTLRVVSAALAAEEIALGP